jgi:hypothetical protein
MNPGSAHEKTPLNFRLRSISGAGTEKRPYTNSPHPSQVLPDVKQKNRKKLTEGERSADSGD